MASAVRAPCPECGHRNSEQSLVCDLCGEVLRRPPAAPSRAPRATVVHVRHEERAPFGEPLSTTLRYVALGVALAPVFTFTPILRYMGWFLSSLVHEMGHCAVAWAAGCPAFPAIRIDGHAAAVHSERVPFLCLVFLGILCWLAWNAWRHRQGRGRLLLFGGAALFYPLFAFTGLRELFFLLGGHLGELAFAGVFLWRGLVGGFTETRSERVAYLTVGSYLVGNNLWLSGGLIFDEGVRAWYRGSGSFGLTNDYLRVSHEVLGAGLGAVAFGMLLVTLAVPVLVWLLARAD